MIQLLTTIEIILSILLITSVLLQHRGTGLGGAFGGEGNIYRSRRGAERALYIMTIIFAALFSLVAVVIGITI